MESQCAMHAKASEEEEIGRAIPEYKNNNNLAKGANYMGEKSYKKEQLYKEVSPELDTNILAQPKGRTYLDYPTEESNEAGLNLEKESRIPTEEEMEDNSQDVYNRAERMFMELHPNEQNEIIIKVFKERSRELNALEKDVNHKRNLYFESIINGI